MERMTEALESAESLAALFDAAWEAFEFGSMIQAPAVERWAFEPWRSRERSLRRLYRLPEKPRT